MKQLIIDLLSGLTVLSHIGLALAVAYYFFSKKAKFLARVTPLTLHFVFLVALVATAGSLFFSLYADFAPCELCWYQRIFMYPLVLLFGLGLWRDERKAMEYAVPLVAIGWLVAAYHNYIYFLGTRATSCSLEAEVSCITPYFTEYGYVTIPVMSMTAFSLIAFALFVFFRQSATAGLKSDIKNP